jgi:hypothetical protein
MLERLSPLLPSAASNSAPIGWEVVAWWPALGRHVTVAGEDQLRLYLSMARVSEQTASERNRAHFGADDQATGIFDLTERS